VRFEARIHASIGVDSNAFSALEIARFSAAFQRISARRFRAVFGIVLSAEIDAESHRFGAHFRPDFSRVFASCAVIAALEILPHRQKRVMTLVA
jgi:hypothetical protein